jgi:glycosyltransferase involved in cell wall biosynthesis
VVGPIRLSRRCCRKRNFIIFGSQAQKDYLGYGSLWSYHVGERSNFPRSHVKVSVLILTLNEEINIAACLGTLSWSDDIVVLDSFSSDATTGIAAEHGARVVQRTFDTYSTQRNFGLTGIAYRNEWLLMIDADERVPEELKTEILAFVANPPADITLCLMRRRDHLYGRWIRRSSGYPTWFGRLARLGHVWVERPINEEYHTRGKTVQLRGNLDHYPFNKGFAEWFAKHDRYSTSEAALKFSRKRDRPHWRELLSRNPLQHRKNLKSLAYMLPGRPLLMFVALYIVKGGFMEGRAGLTFSLLRVWYEFVIDIKVHELQRRERGLPV